MIRIKYYTSIRKVPTDIWEQFVKRQGVGLEPEHLRAVEVAKINDIHPYYIIGYQKENPIGIAYCFAINIDMARMSKSYPPEVLETVKIWKPDFMKVRVLEVGHIASLGCTIEVLETYLSNFLSVFSRTLDKIGKLENADLCMIRDISLNKYSNFQTLKQYGYQLIKGFSIARIPLHWNQFDEYLVSLKSKKRNKIKRKRSKLEQSEIAVEIIKDYAPYANRLAELWENVAQKNSGYEHERLTPAYFKAMNKYLNGRSHVVAIKKNDEIVAYGLNLIGDEEYFGVAEGLDYQFRDQYDLYANNIFEGLDVACKLHKKTFNIGVTAYDFKTSIGAELEPCFYFVKALKNPSYTTVYADFIQKNITQPKTNSQIQTTKPDGVELSKTDSLDPFAKHYNYNRVDTARSADIYPYCPVFESAQEPIIKYKGRDVIMLGTNSYLGLATHPKIEEAAKMAIDKFGSGSSGSPLLNGTLDLHKQLAGELAKFVRKEDALVFSTGYQTNVGVISALVNRNDVLIMDECNHASLIDGARLSGATVVRYKHNDIQFLEEALKRYETKPKLVVTDSLFSMEGTIINLPEIVRLVNKYHARLMLDESHAIGVMGPTGRGVAEQYGLFDEVDIIMGTFSKSFASIGGFVAGERKIIDTLKHTARSYVFSASLPPSAVATVLAAIEIISEEPERRIDLLENARFLADGLIGLGFNVGYHGSPIISVMCGHELLPITAFHKLFEDGVFVNPVTWPAVPKNHEMLRISLMATHNEETLIKALNIFEQIRTRNWPDRGV